MIHGLQSVRGRLLVWHGALSALLIAGFAVTTYQLEKHRRFSEIDARLTQKLGLLSNALRHEKRPEKDFLSELSGSFRDLLKSEFGSENGFYCAVWHREPRPIVTSVSCPNSVLRPMDYFDPIQMRSTFREMHLSMAPVDHVLVGINMVKDLRELNRLAQRLWIAGFSIFFGGLLIGAWLSRRAAAPIESIIRSAQRVAQGQLSERITLGSNQGELSHLAEQLNRCFEGLENLFQKQGRFTSAAAHELRTPLAVVLSQTQSILRRDRSPEEYREALDAINKAAHRMRRLIEMLLDLARIDAENKRSNRKSIDLAKVAKVQMDLVQPSCAEAGLRLTESLQPTFADVDSEHLEVILSNLLNNAVRHNIAHGWIHLSTCVVDGQATVAIENSSEPIAPELLPSLFERFFRADPARKGEGAGLGLSIANELARLNGGSIKAESTEAAIRFTLLLPTPHMDCSYSPLTT